LSDADVEYVANTIKRIVQAHRKGLLVAA
jgi:hypothetical protein